MTFCRVLDTWNSPINKQRRKKKKVSSLNSLRHVTSAYPYLNLRLLLSFVVRSQCAYDNIFLLCEFEQTTNVRIYLSMIFTIGSTLACKTTEAGPPWPTSNSERSLFTLLHYITLHHITLVYITFHYIYYNTICNCN